METILGNKTAAKLMLYLYHYGEAFASGVSKDMEITLSYKFNPKLVVVKKLKELVGSFYESIPLEEKEKMLGERRRPRRRGKPVIKG